MKASYSIGDGFIVAPFLVVVFGLPVHTVAGVAFFQLLVATGLGTQSRVAPDRLLGLVLDAGVLARSYTGVRLQQFLSEFWIKAILGSLTPLLVTTYVW